MTWKIINTYRERCKTGPTHNWCWKWSPFNTSNIIFIDNSFGPLARESPCIKYQRVFFLHSSSVKQWFVWISQELTSGFRCEADENWAQHRSYIRLFNFSSRAKKGNLLFSICFEKKKIVMKSFLSKIRTTRPDTSYAKVNRKKTEEATVSWTRIWEMKKEILTEFWCVNLSEVQETWQW